jgi:hypothetical protein
MDSIDKIILNLQYKISIYEKDATEFQVYEKF